MESNLNLNQIAEEKFLLPEKPLLVLMFIGLVGSLFNVLPFLLNSEYDFLWKLLNVGDYLMTIAEVVFVSLIAYKLYKEGVTKPSYALIACYPAVLVFDTLVSLISEEFGEITTILSIVVTLVCGIIFLTENSTKKIGMWQLIVIACSIIMFAIISESDGQTDKGLTRILLFLILAPQYKYYMSCMKFLTGQQVNEE